ncbi:MAG: exodeoxyribonuclease VII large subunit [Crocinitomix sp.]|nr:exodeoxyribonuclease VII large subunit [Crocinitomix sp.]
MEETRNIYTLSALNQSLERFVRDNFALKNFWVLAEITKVQEKNGHYYLDLADSKEGKRVAEIAANMWFNTFNRVNTQLNGELPSIFKHGNKILINIRIEFHPIYGLKLNILDVDPSITYGEIEKLKKETILRLKSEGLFTRQKAIYLPAIVKKIALVGSPNTSGYRDFLTELINNKIYTNFKVKEFSASVQGDYAVKEIVAAINKANEYSVDLIIVVRGGGSKMDLNVFNDYEIAKTIALSKLPVITGIGHESDEVVADLVAHHNEITPTAVAKFLYERIGIFASEMNTAFDAIITRIMEIVAGRKDEFYHLSKNLIYATTNTLQTENNLIKDLVHGLELSSSELIETEKSKLELNLSRVRNYALNLIDLKKSTELDSQLEKIMLMGENLVDKSKIHLANLNELLDLLNPEQLLKKGYTISTIENIDIDKYTGELNGGIMKTLSYKTLITSQITDTKKNV